MHITKTLFYKINFSNTKYSICCRDKFLGSCHVKDFPQFFQHRNLNFFTWIKLKFSYAENMETISTDISIPSSVRHMKELDRKAFDKKIVVPSILLEKVDLYKLLSRKKLKEHLLLKIPKLNPVTDCSESNTKSRVLLNPLAVKSNDVIDQIFKENCLKFEYEYITSSVTLKYENWVGTKLLRAILPEESEGCAGYSMIGHILHLNLKDDLLPYKYIIAEVLLDKTPAASLVVNKTNTIDNTYRNFAMERLAGEGDMVATVVEYGSTYKMDFSKVYWNSRLGAEHNRVTEKVKEGDVMYDIMAGIGPFVIPAAKKKCTVLANDLNPFSFEYLQKNVTINKVQDRVTCYNLDGNLFIETVVKDHLVRLYKDSNFTGNIHIPMNLPAIATTFLPTFIGLLSEEPNDDNECNNHDILSGKNLPIIHVYMFTHYETKEFAMHMVAKQLGYTFNNLICDDTNVKTLDSSEILSDIDKSFLEYVLEVVNVRRIAPAKIMMRVSFSLPAEILLKRSLDSHLSKKIKLG